ncbi:MAG: HYR domain-containing protein, partial [Bacteroidota bacterium]
IANYSLSKSLFTCADQGISTVTLSVSDAAGNTGTCTALITVQDNLPPSMRCKDVAVTLGSSGTAVVTSSQLDDGSSDNCSSQLTFTPASFSFNTSNVGNHVVTLTATDERGNAATCTPVITVNGIVGPTASCRDVTVSLDASGSATVNSAQLDNGSYNNQSGPITLAPASITYSCADVGMKVVTLTVTDNLGNSATCTSQVTVQDVTPPVASCLNTTATLSTSGTATVSSAELGVNSSDNCGGPLVFTPVNAVFTCVSVGTNTVSLTVTDTHGNTSTCTSQVTIQDAIAPVAFCRDVILSLDASGMATLSGAQLDNGSLDNCSAQLLLSPVSTTYNCADAGVRTVTLMVTDMSGNTATCNSTLTVRDASAPVALCRDVTASLNASGLATVFSAEFDNGSSDNCGSPLTLSPASITWFCAEAGTHVVTLTVSDRHGNTASCTSTVTVQDLTPPVVYCRNTTKALNTSGAVTISSGDLDAGSYDSCNGQLVFSPATVNYTCADLGTNQVVLTVTDANGNSASCISQVSVIDITAPVALCRDVTAVLDASGQVTVSSAQLDNGSSDNCTGQLVFSPANTTFSCADAGARTITLYVADTYGNVATCNSLITVQDITAPVALCRDVTVSLNSAGTATVSSAQLDNGSSDNCSVLNFTPSSVSYTCADAGMQQVTLTVSDNSGHTASCTSTITVEDSAAPVAVCRNLTVSLDDSGTATVLASQVNNGSYDGCTPQQTLVLTPSMVV